MTAPKQNLKSKAAHSDSTDRDSINRVDSHGNSCLLTRQKLQRGWLVAFGLMSSCGLVTSQINFAKAESDHTDGEYALEASYLEDPESPLSIDSVSASLPTSQIAEPTVTTVAAPSFSEPKVFAEKAVYRSHPLVGMIEPGMAVAPMARYVATPVSMTAYASASPTPEAAPAMASELIAETAPEPAAPAAIAQPAPVPAAAPPKPMAIPAAPVVEIAPEAAPVFTPAPTAEQPVPATPTPAEIVPAALPEGITRPGEYDSIFVDPTDYGVGATKTPDVVVAEQSTGCTFTVTHGQGVPNGACNTASPAGVASGNTAATGAGAIAPTATYGQNSQTAASVASASAVNVGPVSFSASGIRLSTSAAGRAYLNRSVRPVVNLQAAAKFIFPLSVPSPISSLFGFRLHPISGDQRFHAGTDIAAPQGTPVLAAQDGTVAAAGEAGGYGLMVVLEHDLEEATLESRYAHLSEIFVESGKAVKKGDVVGLVGSTGNSTGPHLHFEMRQLTANGWVLVNPDGMVQASLARLVQVLNNPVQTISFNLSDFDLKNLRAGQKPASASELPPLPGQDGIPYRPAQPNAS